MTREEYDDLVSKTLHAFDRNYVHKSYIASLEQRNTELEQRVKELEEENNIMSNGACAEWSPTIDYQDGSTVMYQGKICIVNRINNPPKDTK